MLCWPEDETSRINKEEKKKTQEDWLRACQSEENTVGRQNVRNMHKLSIPPSLSHTHTYTPSESFVEIPRRVGGREDDHRLRAPAGTPAPGLYGNAVHLDE